MAWYLPLHIPLLVKSHVLPQEVRHVRISLSIMRDFSLVTRMKFKRIFSDEYFLRDCFCYKWCAIGAQIR